MRVSLVADVHIGNHQLFGGQSQGGLNARCMDCLDVLGESSRYADDLHIVAGDVFDTDLPSPAMLSGAQRHLRGADGRETVIVNGNHDMTSEAHGHSAVAPLESPADNVSNVYGAEWYHGNTLCVGHRTGPAKVWLPEVLKGHPRPAGFDGPALLVLHLGLEHAGTPPYLRRSDDSIHVDQLSELCQGYGISHVASGNWHSVWYSEHRGVCLRQIGALVPTGFDNLGIVEYGRVAHWDTCSSESLHPSNDSIVPGPRFVKYKSIVLLRGASSDIEAWGNDHKLYLHAELPDTNREEAADILEDYKSRGVVEQYKLTRPPGHADQVVKKAAQSVANSGSLNAALLDYTTRLNLPEGVTTEGVLSASRRLLKLGDA